MNATTYAFLPQPWLNAGLRLLLLPSEARVKELRAPAPLEQKPAPKAPVQRASAATPGSEKVFYQGAAPRSASRNMEVGQTALPSPASHPAEAEAQPLDPKQWGPAWRNLLEGRKWPPHPKVLWTYAGLGHDLAGQPLAERRNVVAALLQGLGHVPGTHVFWPYALPDDEADPAVMFCSGVKLFQPRVLVVLGSEARDILNLPKIKPYQYALAFSRRLFMLPQPASMHNRPDLVQSVLAYLGENLRFCPRSNA